MRATIARSGARNPTSTQRIASAAGTDLGPVFGSIRSRDVRSIAGPVFDVHAKQGAQLICEGQPTGTFFVIRSGQGELWRGRSMLRTLGPGDCFGEIDPETARPQRFTVIASSPLRLLTFSAYGIQRLCATIPGAKERIVDCLPQSHHVERRKSQRPSRRGPLAVTPRPHSAPAAPPGRER